ncbi:MAG: UDP-2,3-diacylglucosamine diphosphatase, partial [Bacteroidetes bacterium]|nr:UDP-2,3-diacylglucosamine diphosphatase [Candidatus Caccoplasma merdipullorum]
MDKGKRVYFISDMHLGASTLESPRETEKRVVRWLDSVKDTASAIYMLGDVLDYWYEYR